MNALATESAMNASTASYCAESGSARMPEDRFIAAGAGTFTNTLNEMIRAAGEKTGFAYAAFRNGQDLKLSRDLRAPYSPVSENNESSSAFERKKYEDIQSASAGPVYRDTGSHQSRSGSATETSESLSGRGSGNSGADKAAASASSKTHGDSAQTNGTPVVSGQSLITDESALDPALGTMQSTSLTLLQQASASNATLIPGGTAISQGALVPDNLLGMNTADTIMQGTPVGGVFTSGLSQITGQPGIVEGIGVAYEDLASQLIHGIRIAQSSESTEILVRLKPDFLGRLTIRVLANEHGMHVEIRTENEAVRQMMQNNLADLEQRLAEEGLELSQFNILADTGRRSHQEKEWSFRPSDSLYRTDPVGSLENDRLEVILTRRGIIDYLA